LYNALATRSAFDVDSVSALGIPNLQPGDPVTWGVPFASFAGTSLVAIGDAQDGPDAIDDNTLQLWTMCP